MNIFILQSSLKASKEYAASVAEQRDRFQKKLQEKEVNRELFESLGKMQSVTFVQRFVVYECQPLEVTE